MPSHSERRRDFYRLIDTSKTFNAWLSAQADDLDVPTGQGLPRQEGFV